MMHVLFRCDASLSIGSGHVIRCRTLARVLRQKGAKITFLCRRQAGDLIGLLENEFRVIALSEQPLASCEGLAGRELYGAWLGCSQDQDVKECLESLFHSGISRVNWLVVDHYGLDVYWESKLLAGLATNFSIKLFVIDDLADRSHQADLLLDQNFFTHSTHERYSDLVPEHCRKLLGPSYSLLGPEYAYLHPLIPLRQELHRVLVFFGGVDSMNLTGRALDVFSQDSFSELAVDVVLGLQSEHRDDVAELVKRRPLTTIHASLPSLAGLIARADLAIGAGGASTWERACLGLTTITVPIAHNQFICAEEFCAATNSPMLALSDFDSKLPEIIMNYSHHQESLMNAGGEAFKMTDGQGCKLTVSEILK